jgi:hypothetical protein
MPISEFYYNTILRFYPAAYREAFAAEMIETHQQASAEARNRGPLACISFSARELTGLLTGLFSEWVAKWTASGPYITSRCSSRAASDGPPEIAEVQTRLDQLIRSMEFAIAHHDFPKARFYANEERITRARLQQLMNKSRFSDGLPV